MIGDIKQDIGKFDVVIKQLDLEAPWHSDCHPL